MSFISVDKMSITLPVPLGSTVYSPDTTCNDACLFQEKRFNEVFPPTKEGRCSMDMPCHVRYRGINAVTFTLDNLHYILPEWDKRYFISADRAKIFIDRVIEEHKQQLISLGLEV